MQKCKTIGFMFDTNIFDELLNNEIDLSLLPKNFKYYATHIQGDEIESMGDNKKEKRNQLLSIFSDFNGSLISTEVTVCGVSQLGSCKLGNGVKIPTEAAVWGVSRWDECKWGDGVKIPTENLVLDVSKLDEAKLGGITYFEALNSDNDNHIEDALIGETAIVNGLVLVSNDEKFRNKVNRMGGSAISFKEFIELE
jgi:predicted nucleic acid-binding protein